MKTIPLLTTKDGFLDSSLESAPRVANGVGLGAKDRKSMIFLTVLYLVQGIPVGLTMGAFPYILKDYVSYGTLGYFSLSSWPYSLKLIWSPLVDGLYCKKLGRRRSWLLPSQCLVGFSMLYISHRIEYWMSDVNKHIINMSTNFFVLVTACATQDIAVDGFALELLSEENICYASTAQTIGLNTGFLFSYTVLLALSSPEFANAYIRSRPKDTGLLSLSDFIMFWGILNLLMTFWVARVGEKSQVYDSWHGKEFVARVYKSIYQIFKKDHVRIFTIIHLISKLGFIITDAMTLIVLIEKQLKKEHVALIAILNFPIEILASFLAAKWSAQSSQPLLLWRNAFVGRIAASIISMFVVYIYNPEDSRLFFWILVISQGLANYMSTIQFVCMTAFHTKIADPAIGGTYMTLLNTLYNFGGIWPKFFIFKMIDFFSNTWCIASTSKYIVNSKQSKIECKYNGDKLYTDQRGYYILNVLCLMISIATYSLFISKNIKKIEKLSLKSWKIY